MPNLRLSRRAVDEISNPMKGQVLPEHDLVWLWAVGLSQLKGVLCRRASEPAHPSGDDR